MKASTNPSPKENPPSQQIDAIIKESGDWRGKKLSELRALIKKADPAVIEEVKWKMPSKPMGVPVWSHDGIICHADVLTLAPPARADENAVRLTFHKGAQMKDPRKLFNTRLDSKTVRAIDFHESDPVDEAALKALILDAAGVNISKSAKSKAKTAISSGRSSKRFAERVDSLVNPDLLGESNFLHGRTNA